LNSGKVGKFGSTKCIERIVPVNKDLKMTIRHELYSAHTSVKC
jgi:hypothetical protein